MSNSATSPAPTTTGHVVVMGVSGCGKSTVGRALAARIGYEFTDGDDFHPSRNIEKMRAGVPLTDADRHSWLHALAAWLREQDAAGHSTVLACSALKRSYRDILRGSGVANLFFAELDAPSAVLQSRLEGRDHFMPASLLASQLDTLEPLSDDETGVRLDAGEPVDDLVAQILTVL